jgi:HD-like signal output (HDOD) protein
VTQLAEIQRAVDRMPALPEVAMRVLQLVSDPEFSTDNLVAVVRTDPMLTARILRLCNSTAFSLSRQIETVSQAVAFLGTRNLVKMVVATCTAAYYRAADRGWRDQSGGLWHHSIACGIAAQSVAEHSRSVDGGSAFTAGILHNIGKVVLAQFLPADDATLGEKIAAHDGDFLELERALCGMDHAAAGGLIADAWYLPVDLRRAIKHHHNPRQILADGPLTAIVHLADLLALQLGFGGGVDAFRHAVARQALDRLALVPTDLDRIRLETLDEIERSRDLLKLD